MKNEIKITPRVKYYNRTLSPFNDLYLEKDKEKYLIYPTPPVLVLEPKFNIYEDVIILYNNQPIGFLNDISLSKQEYEKEVFQIVHLDQVFKEEGFYQIKIKKGLVKIDSNIFFIKDFDFQSEGSYLINKIDYRIYINPNTNLIFRNKEVHRDERNNYYLQFKIPNKKDNDDYDEFKIPVKFKNKKYNLLSGYRALRWRENESSSWKVLFPKSLDIFNKDKVIQIQNNRNMPNSVILVKQGQKIEEGLPIYDSFNREGDYGEFTFSHNDTSEVYLSFLDSRLILFSRK